MNIRNRAAFLAGFALVAAPVAVWADAHQPDPASAPAVSRPDAPGSPAALIAANDCWTQNAPAGVIPGHVVARKPGHATAAVYGPRVTGQALRQVFDGEDHGLTIHAFCR